jgi:hypothetical protein
MGLREENEMGVRDRAAKALYDRWRATDAELAVEWADAGDRLRGVFLRQVETVLGEVAVELERVVSNLDVHESELRMGGDGVSCWYFLETELTRKGLL